jgi:hypothetical protein
VQGNRLDEQRDGDDLVRDQRAQGDGAQEGNEDRLFDGDDEGSESLIGDGQAGDGQIGQSGIGSSGQGSDGAIDDRGEEGRDR